MDYFTLEGLRSNHPGWKLLTAANAPLAASFFYGVFVAPNVREVARTELISQLEDLLFEVRESLGSEAFPQPAASYLDDWADDNHGWLRKFYSAGDDEPHYDLTAAAEKAIRWLESLEHRTFVGTESRLMTVFELLRQMVRDSADNPEERIQDLERRKREIEEEITRAQAGDWSLLEGPRLQDRFQQMSDTARQLLADFREVEQNFHQLDRETRRQIALWEGTKAELLERVFGESDAIESSDQGQTFRAFWEFLMTSDRQEELSQLLAKVFQMEEIRLLNPDPRLKRIHHDWLEAGEHAQRTVALLSEQLRRFLDDEVWLENRRIVEILKNIEAHAVVLDGDFPAGEFTAIDLPFLDIDLPMERTLYSPALRPVVNSEAVIDGEATLDVESLFNQVVVDKGVLTARVERALILRSQVTLPELLHQYPLEQGLAELVAYIAIASDRQMDSERFAAAFDEKARDTVEWIDGKGAPRRATVPHIIFSR
ncbi:MAG: DUF3375 domain-containing protein [Thermaerobacter sp.]|nr:DUF3375 domain-containing protein [Thermaerobacter sp.]